MFMEDLQNSLKQELDLLEKEFDSFVKEKGWKQTTQSTTFLRQLRIFFDEKKEVRERILLHTKLHGSDCLTQSNLTKFLGERKGLTFWVAAPWSIKKPLHAIVAYKDSNGEIKFFNIAGKSKYTTGKIMSSRENLIRLKLTKPIIRLANKMKRR